MSQEKRKNNIEKISIIVPVYNEEKKIFDCFNSLVNLDYPKSDFEIVFVNDGSSDNTFEILCRERDKTKEIDIKIINLKENQGRIVARETGAREAKYENLLFIDSRCVADKKVLVKLREINYQPVDGELIIDSKRSIYDRFNWLRAKKMYWPHWGENYEPVFITPENFNRMSKGANIFFVSRDLYLSSIPESKSRNANDDTKLFWNIVKKKKILRHPSPRVYYQSRTTLKKEIPHIFHRGPRFVDYYLKSNSQYFWIFIISPVILLLVSLFLIWQDIFYIFYILVFIFVSLIVISAWMAENVKDFFIAMLLLPLTAGSFLSGVFKGLFLKFLRRY